MGTISGGSHVDPSQQQFLQAQQVDASKYAGHPDGGSLQNTLDVENMNTFGAASTVAHNMENDYMMTMECHQYKQSLDQRRHSHQTLNRQQQQYRHHMYDQNQLVGSTMQTAG